MELWELTDEHGVEQGVFYDRNSGMPMPEGYYFRVAEVWVRCGDKILITQRHPQKWAGLEWEVPGGGVVKGESPREAAARELAEEVGILAPAEGLREIAVSRHKNALVYSFYLSVPAIPEIKLQECEVVDHKFLTAKELDMMKDKMTVGTSSRLAPLLEFIKNNP